MASEKIYITVGIVVGIFLSLGGLRVAGFFGGALQGAGIALILIGVYLLGARWRGTKGGAAGEESEQWWLPSRDERR